MKTDLRGEKTDEQQMKNGRTRGVVRGQVQDHWSISVLLELRCTVSVVALCLAALSAELLHHCLRRFCGETEEEHADTVSLLRAVGYDTAYLFAYSERSKTQVHCSI
eukprot:1191052-Prorocentrum_minimum.AAC.2